MSGRSVDICQKCNTGTRLLTAYVRTSESYDDKKTKSWKDIGYYCPSCKYFEPSSDWFKGDHERMAIRIAASKKYQEEEEQRKKEQPKKH